MITGETCISVQIGSVATKDTIATRGYCATMISIIVAQHVRVVTKVRQKYRERERERKKERKRGERNIEKKR